MESHTTTILISILIVALPRFYLIKINKVYKKSPLNSFNEKGPEKLLYHTVNMFIFCCN